MAFDGFSGYKKALPVIIWNKIHSSKEVVTKTYTLEKMLWEVAFKGLGVVSF